MRINGQERMTFESGMVYDESSQEIIRKSFLLLSLTVLFSAIAAAMPLFGLLPMPRFMFSIGGFILSMVLSFALIYMIRVSAHQPDRAILWTFALTGFTGYTMAPAMAFYLGAFANGGVLILAALTATGLTFLGLALYASYSGRTFDSMRAMLGVGLLALIAASALGLIFGRHYIFEIILAGFSTILFSGYILYEIGQLLRYANVNNYVELTVQLYLSLTNLFLNMLRLMAAFGGSSRDQR